MLRLHPALVIPAALLAPAAALAQSAPSAATAPDDAKAVAGVVVTAKGPSSTSIDRRSYSIASDLQAANGTLADALRNIPSVEVDVQGNVKLRGDPSVTILVDGLPAAQFQGANQGDALQAFPANTVDRIEVMTNPSAEFTSQGTGGVINIITKRGSRTAPPSITLRAGLGTEGRSQIGGNASFNAGPVSVTADGSFKHDPRDVIATSDTVSVLPGQSAAVAAHYASQTSGHADSVNAGIKLGYQLDPHTSFSGQARVNSLDLASSGAAQSLIGPGPGALGPDYNLTTVHTLSLDTVTLGAGLRRTFSGDQHEFTADFQHQSNPRLDVTRTAQAFSRSATSPAFQDISTDYPLNQDTLKLAYRRPMPANGRLVISYDVTGTQIHTDVTGLGGASTTILAPEPVLANDYRANGLQQAFYGTYQQPFGKLTVLAGLRIETLGVDLRSLGAALPRVSETNLDPSLNLSWSLDDKSKLAFNYSRRLQRPAWTDYDPALTYIDPSNFLQGDPNTRSGKTDSFEAAYQHQDKGTSYSATVYYRNNWDVLTTIIKPLSGDIQIQQRANAVDSRNGGLELVASGPVLGTLRYDLSGNVYYSDIHGGGGLGNQSGTVLNGRANLNWSPTDADLFQLNAISSGRYIAPQGSVAPRYALNLGYRRKLADGLFLTLTGQDVLGGFSMVNVATASPVLNFRSSYRYNGPAGILSLSYTFGGGLGRKKAAPDLEYGGGPGP
jgi:outer membrane receptor protein involved in Fe transport